MKLYLPINILHNCYQRICDEFDFQSLVSLVSCECMTVKTDDEMCQERKCVRGEKKKGITDVNTMFRVNKNLLLHHVLKCIWNGTFCETSANYKQTLRHTLEHQEKVLSKSFLVGMKKAKHVLWPSCCVEICLFLFVCIAVGKCVIFHMHVKQ